MLTVIGYTDDAENLANALGCQMNGHAQVAVHFGSRRTVNCTYSLNKPKAIELATHKYNTLVAFRKYGLPTPEFSLDPTMLNFPLLGRGFYHSCGTDIVYIEGWDKFKWCDYYIEFMPVEDEYRYHIVGYQCVSASVKVGGNPNAVCRNLRTGWRFEEVESDSSLETMSIFATRALGLHFGAVDIIISGGKPYLLEINTAPGLIDRRVRLYAKEIKWLADNLTDLHTKKKISQIQKRTHNTELITEK